MEIDFDFSKIMWADYNLLVTALQTHTIGSVSDAVNMLQNFTSTPLRDIQFSDTVYLIYKAYIILQDNMWLWLQEK